MELASSESSDPTANVSIKTTDRKLAIVRAHNDRHANISSPKHPKVANWTAARGDYTPHWALPGSMLWEWMKANGVFYIVTSLECRVHLLSARYYSLGLRQRTSGQSFTNVCYDAIVVGRRAGGTVCSVCVELTGAQWRHLPPWCLGGHVTTGGNMETKLGRNSFVSVFLKIYI